MNHVLTETLNGPQFYRQEDNNLTSYHNQKVKEKVEEMLQAEKTTEYLVIQQPGTAKFYLLPKIHKNKIRPPGRPIVSVNDCPTERIWQLVDKFIQPLVTTLPSFIRDSSHFLQQIKDLKLPRHAILATLDVTSLYTNIPNDDGIKAVHSALAKHRNPLENSTNNNSIIQLLKLVLTCNNFEFDNNHFLQVGGNALGRKLAPSYANVFMGDFEGRHVYNNYPKPLIWKRFTDDIFLVWLLMLTHADTAPRLTRRAS